MSIAATLKSRLKQFNTNTRANVALMVGLSAVPMILATGASLDYAHALKVKTHLQAALDNAALAAGFDTSLSDEALTEIVKKYLRKNGVEKGLKSLDKVAVARDGETGLKVSASGQIKTYLMGVAGIKSLKINAKTYIKNNFGNLEVALVLDNTWSMSAGGKMSALKDSAHLLVDKLHDNKGPSSDLRIGLVPFSQYVNIGLSRRNALWANVPADYEETKTYPGYWYRPVVRRYNCRKQTRTGVRDGVPYSYQVSVCDKEYGEKKWHPGGSWVKKHKWHGCVGSRNYPLNIKDTSPSSKIPGLLDVKCAREFTTLTDRKSTIKSEIDNMTATGNQTYIPAGLMWGWRMLSSNEPLSEGVSKARMKSENYTKAIVLMTDGENTRSPDYPTHNVRNASGANKLTKELCENIKADGGAKEKIRVYTVTFDVTDPATKKMMRQCATNDSYYFDASDSAALAQAFENIGKSLVTLFISR